MFDEYLRKRESIVVEYAVSVVKAGFRGNFGLVLGIARENNRPELFENGADVVVEDLEEINGIYELNQMFQEFYRKKLTGL